MYQLRNRVCASWIDRGLSYTSRLGKSITSSQPQDVEALSQWAQYVGVICYHDHSVLAMLSVVSFAKEIYPFYLDVVW